ncbi:MAG: helix-turn-helix transcriptional regulator [Coprococcus sp.]|nr:helix-turn-helix transcriptional regulator [Coprococcus sp.]
MNQQNIGLLIATKRREQNLTQEQLAEKIRVSNKTVSKWETGKVMPLLNCYVRY